jgi:threonine aldolase
VTHTLSISPLYHGSDREDASAKQLPGLAGADDMESRSGRNDFVSDNTAGICPAVLSALQKANTGDTPPYGEDQWTARLRELVRELFETDCESYLVFNGTAANALALAQICQSFNAVVCHENAHIQTDECGAPEFFTKGSKLLLAGGDGGKIDLAKAAVVVERQPELHAPKSRVISITQATEFGTVYTADQIATTSEFARRREMLVHMDGARFANAIASLSCAPKEITWQVGVDVLCFGGTKNGLAAGELVVFFKKDLALEFDYRLKQAGQLASKTRFIAAPWVEILEKGIWLQNAQHANRMARILANRLQSEANLQPVFPIEANAVFISMGDRDVAALGGRGWQFYKFCEPDVYRLMCSWSTTDRQVDDFMVDLRCVR